MGFFTMFKVTSEKAKIDKCISPQQQFCYQFLNLGVFLLKKLQTVKHTQKMLISLLFTSLHVFMGSQIFFHQDISQKNEFLSSNLENAKQVCAWNSCVGSRRQDTDSCLFSQPSPVQKVYNSASGSVAEELCLEIVCASLNLLLFHLLNCHLIHLFSLSLKGECVYLPHD